MLATMNDEFVSKVIDADDRSYADERDQSQEHLKAHESRQLRAQMLVA